MDVDAAADELYAVAPEEFTAHRNAAAKRAAADGEPDLAEAIRSLPKPKLAAWVVNTLVRNHSVEIDALLKLGAALRDATERLHGDELATLSKQQRQVIGALVKLAVDDADDAGQRISTPVARSVEQTLRAALADPESAAELAAGRLAEPLDYVGFPGGLSVSGSGAKRRSVAGTTGNDPADEAREAAFAETRDAIKASQRDSESATAARAEVDHKIELLSGHLAEVRLRVKELSDQLRAAERDQRAATKTQEQATAAVDAAERRLAELNEGTGAPSPD